MGLEKQFCTYLTIYSGNLLPKRYIGSTQIKRVTSGYHGSVKSKRYKSLFKQELNDNPSLFKTRILSTHDTHAEAIAFELFLHIKYDVVKSTLYMNQSFACPNGFFGKSQIGEAHPFYGRHHTDETKKKVSDGLKLAYKDGRIKSGFIGFDTAGDKNPFYGKHHTDETKKKMRKPKRHVPRWKCKDCDKILDAGNLSGHMKWKHNYTLDQVNSYRQSTTPTL